MNIIKEFKNWKALKETTDIDKVRVTHSGSFYMKSEDLFDDKDEVNDYVKKINESLKKFQKNAQIVESKTH